MQKKNKRRNKNMEGGNVGMDGGNRKGETWLGRKESKKKGTMRSRKENANICRRVRELEIKEQREEREKRRFSGIEGGGHEMEVEIRNRW